MPVNGNATQHSDRLLEVEVDMDEQEIAQKILQSMLGTVTALGTRRVRIINLSMYSRRLDPEAFTTSFETLTRGTIAQDARVRLRFRTTEFLAQLPDYVFAKLKTEGVCLDSVEVD
jgi:Zn finger protein HypA/HybF involved in hydrogenase expression